MARYWCLKCSYIWEERLKGQTHCQRCGHLYVKWLNYEEMKKKATSGFGIEKEIAEAIK